MKRFFLISSITGDITVTTVLQDHEFKKIFSTPGLKGIIDILFSNHTLKTGQKTYITYIISCKCYKLFLPLLDHSNMSKISNAMMKLFSVPSVKQLDISIISTPLSSMVESFDWS